ncbi:DUF4262 domain-containing protein [Sphingobium sp.]|uniref:DUF4262 domain-containing protein n=1 Tax=Sphingobium sp. TaxID=1912891 RepID=UPI003B3B664D
MRTALDRPNSALDDQEREFLADIRKHGWFNTRVFDDEDKLPDFSNSTGFFSSLGFPEIIVFSLSKETCHSILWDIFRDVQAGEKPPIGVRTTNLLGNAEAILLPVSKFQYHEHMGWSRWFYSGDDFPCLQLVWPDREGRFPWESHFDLKFKDSQPDLTDSRWHGFG